MGSNSSQLLPQIIQKTWRQTLHNPQIYVNSLTYQQVRQHILKTPTPFELDSLRSRLKQTNISVCRVAFYFHADSERFHIYTDQNRSFTNAENKDLWQKKKQDVVTAFRYLAKTYGNMRVCQGMIGMDKTGEVKCWIHPNVLSAQVWSSCQSEQEMLGDIDVLFEGVQDGNKKRRRNSTTYEGLRYPKIYENCNKFGGINRIQQKNSNIKKILAQTHKIGNLPYFLRQNESTKGSICSNEKTTIHQNTVIKTFDSINENEQEDQFVFRRTRTCNANDLEANNFKQNKRKTSMADQSTSWFKKIQKKTSLEYEIFTKVSKINTSQNSSDVPIKNKESNAFNLSQTMKPSQKMNLIEIQVSRKRSSFSIQNKRESDERKREKVFYRSIEKKILTKQNFQTQLFSIHKHNQNESNSMKLSKRLVNVACLPVLEERQSQLACIENQQDQAKENGTSINSFVSFFDEEEKAEYFEIQNKIKAKNCQFETIKKQFNKLLLEVSL